MPLRLLTVLAGLVGALLALASPAVAAPWQWPLAGPPQVVRPFAPGPADWSPGHRGADLAGAPGAPVLAAGAGRVSYAGLLAGRGVVVVVHGDLRTTYEPVTPSVRPGRPVAAGDALGTLAAGHPGCPAAACLHWGLLRGETYLDPLGLVGRGPVRLLPLGPGAAPAPGPPAGVATAAGAPVVPPRAVADGPGAPPGRRTATLVTGGALALAAAGAARRPGSRPP